MRFFNGTQTASAKGTFAFSQAFDELPYIYISANQSWIRVGDTIYDLNSGQLITILDASHIISAALSFDQMTLYLITIDGLESWQVLQ